MLHTTLYQVQQVIDEGQNAIVARIAQHLHDGELVAIPTETVYGLAANALDEHAVARIFQAKGRPADNPLIVHVADAQQMQRFAVAPNLIEQRLIEAFWPGPLTMIFPVKSGVLPANVTAGLDTVAVRQPAHPLALEVLRACHLPLAAPSANRSGKPSPTKAQHVLDDLNGKITAILDGGATQIGIESTVVHVVEGVIHILRAGAITAKQLAEAVPGVTVMGSDAHEIDMKSNLAPRSPGVKYAHYAPRGMMTVVQSNDKHALFDWAAKSLAEAKRNGHTTGVLTYNGHESLFENADFILTTGEAHDSSTLARVLYDCLREFDRLQVTYILAEACAESEIGVAVMNRLLKAAGQRFVRV